MKEIYVSISHFMKYWVLIYPFVKRFMNMLLNKKTLPISMSAKFLL